MGYRIQLGANRNEFHCNAAPGRYGGPKPFDVASPIVAAQMGASEKFTQSTRARARRRRTSSPRGKQVGASSLGSTHACMGHPEAKEPQSGTSAGDALVGLPQRRRDIRRRFSRGAKPKEPQGLRIFAMMTDGDGASNASAGGNGRGRREWCAKNTVAIF